MNIQNINDEFGNNSLRCERVYPLFAFAENAMENHEIIEQILDYDKSLNTALDLTDSFFDELDELERWQKHDEIEAFLYRRNKLNGYLAKFAKPIITKFYAKGGYQESWGYYTTTWLYAETMEELFQKSFDWAKECHERDRAEWEKANEKAL